MSNIIEFKFPDKGAFDPLLVSDPVPDRLSKEGRLIYLRIIEKSPPGVLLQIDRLAVELAVSSTEVALKYGFYEGSMDNLINIFNCLLLPELGEEYIAEILGTG